MPFLLSTLKIEQNIFEDLFLHLQQLRSSSKGAERSKHLQSAQYIHHCVALLLQTKTKSLANRNRTSDRWISVLRYSPPLYQLSYRELGCIKWPQINY